MLYRVEKPAATDRIAGLGYANALIERSIKRGESEVADHPAICNLVIENKRVSIVCVPARRWQSGKECIERGRARQGVAVLIKNLDRYVGHFHIMVRTNIPICVRWKTTAKALRRVDPIKGQQRRRHAGRWAEDVFK